MIASWASLAIGMNGPIHKGRDIEVTHVNESHPGFRSASDLERDDLGEIEPTGQGFVQVESIHAHDALAASEGMQALRCETALADDESAGPACHGLDLCIEGPKRLRVDPLVPPPAFDQIGLLDEDEAAVDLFAFEFEGGACA